MDAEIWISAGIIAVAVGGLGAWLVQEVKAELTITDEWWTPRDPSTVAHRDKEKLLRDANRGQS